MQLHHYHRQVPAVQYHRDKQYNITTITIINVDYNKKQRAQSPSPEKQTEHHQARTSVCGAEDGESQRQRIPTSPLILDQKIDYAPNGHQPTHGPKNYIQNI